ncbi:hypothetical protein K469DRAFT_697983 [Zopfia rhizophila CBS 207.26]|uniref:SAP domain-containing protein n=1 Tax=Zopfia rhizophila CBS 207.26 TaxID=1314779 RepID=A0A6A6EHH5_9PEZI|nr:hypothetical protein K469DRAFT_697983 [Zopfia rhizophila CBS 207.26]
MPASKRQKASDGSSVDSSKDASSSPTPHKNDTRLRDPKTIAPHEYICIHRPYFDVKLEEFDSEKHLDSEQLFEKYKNGFDEEKKKGIFLQPAGEHEDWKWVIMWDSWKMFCDWERRELYCNPDLFGMYIYNDWCGWGLQELLENLLVAFNKEITKRPYEQSLHRMWAVISALGIWINQIDMTIWSLNGYAEKTYATVRMVGCTILTALNALDLAGELKSDSKFLDLGLVMSEFLNWADGLEGIGIEDEDLKWRRHVVAYFRKAGIHPSNGVCGTSELLKRYNSRKDTKEAKNNRWDWDSEFNKYRKDYGTPQLGGTHYDITKFTRKERAAYAFDKKDPLANLSQKDIREGNLDFE